MHCKDIVFQHNILIYVDILVVGVGKNRAGGDEGSWEGQFPKEQLRYKI